MIVLYLSHDRFSILKFMYHVFKLEHTVRRSTNDGDDFIVRRRQFCRDVHEIPDGQEPKEGVFGNSSVHRGKIQNPKRE